MPRLYELQNQVPPLRHERKTACERFYGFSKLPVCVARESAVTQGLGNHFCLLCARFEILRQAFPYAGTIDQ